MESYRCDLMLNCCGYQMRLELKAMLVASSKLLTLNPIGGIDGIQSSIGYARLWQTCGTYEESIGDRLAQQRTACRYELAVMMLRIATHQTDVESVMCKRRAQSDAQQLAVRLVQPRQMEAVISVWTQPDLQVLTMMSMMLLL